MSESAQKIRDPEMERRHAAPSRRLCSTRMRAEATFRDIQVAFGTQGGGGGGGGGRGRDLRTWPISSSTAKRISTKPASSRLPISRSQEIDKALQKLQSSRAGSRNWPAARKISSRPSASAGSRKCCGAKPKS